MKRLLLLPLTIILFSCSGESEEQDIISIDELIGETGEIEADSSIIEIDSGYVFNSYLGKFVYSQKSDYDTLIHDDFHWLDRFSYSTSSKLKFIGKKDVPYGKTNMVTPKASLFYYTFNDTTTTKNAFYNWLDCFGSDCDVVKLGEDIGAMKTPPMYTLVYDTTIVIVEYMCEHEKNDWDTFQDSLITKFGRDYRYAINVDCGGPLKWK